MKALKNHVFKLLTRGTLKRKIFLLLGLVTLLAVGGALVIAVVVGHDIVQPVEELSVVARKVSISNDFSLRSSHSGDDEIGQLVSQFNTMLERIDVQNKELNEAQDVLELKIEERTRELDLSDRALNAAVNGVVITRIKDDKIIYCNEAMVHDFSWSKEELLDHSMRILQGADTEVEAVEKLADAVEKGRECKVTLLHYRKDGTTLWNDVSIAPVLNSSGQPTHYIWVLVDVTLALEKENSLRTARDEAEKANKAKSEFLSRMSHELRTPLNSIIGFSKLLSMSNLSGRVEANINRIHQAGLHLLDLINEVLDISRIETGNMSFSSDEIDLQELLHEVGDLVRPLAADLNVALVLPDQQHAGLKLNADKQRLRQVFLNLASNGIKYNREGGSLTIYFEQTSEDRVRVAFQNTGEGIPESKLKRLFQPFDRLDAESDHYQIEGTGLGLALSKKLTEAMGGKIWVRSIMGKETQFFVELSLHNETSSKDESFEQIDFSSKQETRKSDQSKHRLLVLYVEDNPDNLALIEQIVEQREGVKLISAIQGRQGYDLARQHVPDLIFLDLNLSDINGDEVLHLLKSDPTTEQIPVYMLSADAMVSQIKRLKASGAVDYLVKPIDIPKFHSILDDILNS